MASSPKKKDRLERWRAWSAKTGAIDELCEYIVENGVNGHLSAFARRYDFAYTTLAAWLDDVAHPDRAVMYARAREARADVIAEEITEIADEPIADVETQWGSHKDSAHVAHQKLRIEAREWKASKLHPRRYGPKVELEAKHTHDVMGELRDFLLSNGSRLPIGGGQTTKGNE